jgi:hypothetical protein
MHTRRIGIEDVCSHFHEGAHRSDKGLLDDRGIATSREFRAGEPVRLIHFQALIPVAGDVRVASVEPRPEGTLAVELTNGESREFAARFTG